MRAPEDVTPERCPSSEEADAFSTPYSTPTPSDFSHGSWVILKPQGSMTPQGNMTPLTPGSAGTTRFEPPCLTITHAPEDAEPPQNDMQPDEFGHGFFPGVTSHPRDIPIRMMNTGDLAPLKFEYECDDSSQSDLPFHDFQRRHAISYANRFEIQDLYIDSSSNIPSESYEQVAGSSYESEPCHLAFTPEPSSSTADEASSSYPTSREAVYPSVEAQKIKKESPSSNGRDFSHGSSEEEDIKETFKALIDPEGNAHHSRQRYKLELEEKVYCQVCRKSFPRTANFQLHAAIHARHRCTYDRNCTTTFGRPAERERHISTVHIKKESFPCECCGHLFPRKDSLARHVSDVVCQKDRKVKKNSKRLIKTQALIKNKRRCKSADASYADKSRVHKRSCLPGRQHKTKRSQYSLELPLAESSASYPIRGLTNLDKQSFPQHTGYATQSSAQVVNPRDISASEPAREPSASPDSWNFGDSGVE